MNGIRQQSYNFLRKNKVENFPINVKDLIIKNGWIVCGYQEGKSFLESIGAWEYTKDKKGICVYSQEKETYIIFVRDDLGNAEFKQVCAHEIGHIVLDHTATNDILGKSENPLEESTQEHEADIFAKALIAPIPLLIKHNIRTVHDLEFIAALDEELALKVFLEIEAELPRYRQQKAKKAAKVVLSAAAIIFIFGLLIYGVKVLTSDITPKTEQEAFALDKTVAITPAGEKFHELDCRYVKDKSITELTIAEAQEQGKDPCKVCEPLE